MSLGSIQSTEATTALSDRARRTFQTNLHALGRRDPDVAQSVESAELPRGVVFALGRDGEPNLRLLAAERGSRWFARCSMPSIAAAEGLGGFAHEGGSVALPGISTGWEARQLLAKLPPGDAVFVIERDAVAVQMALHLVDLSAALESGRIVLLLGDQWEQALVRLVRTHPGHALPRRIVTIPQRSSAEITNLQQRLESAVAQAAEAQNAAMQAAVTAIRERSTRDTFIERVVVVAGDESPAGLDFAHRIIRGLEAFCTVAAVCLPDRPEHQHLAAPLFAIESAAPDLTIVAGFGWNSLSQVLPDGLALRLVPQAPFGHDPASVDGGGLPAQVFPPAADLGATACDLREERDRTNGVVLIADCPDDRAASIGIQLPSQQAVWNAMRERAAKLARTTTWIDAEELLAHAERTCGAEMRESDVRHDFLRLADQRILPAARLLREWEALQSIAGSAALVGSGWPVESAGPHAAHRSAASLSTDAFIDRFRRAAVVIFAQPLPLLPERILDAAACGCGVAVSDGALAGRMPEDWLARSGRIAVYSSPDALVRFVTAELKKRRPQTIASANATSPDCSTTAKLRKILRQLRP